MVLILCLLQVRSLLFLLLLSVPQAGWTMGFRWILLSASYLTIAMLGLLHLAFFFLIGPHYVVLASLKLSM